MAALVEAPPVPQELILQLEQAPSLDLKSRFQSADSIPELAEAREFERIVAGYLLDQAMEPLRTGDFDEVKPAADALGTAAKYVDACKIYGPESNVAKTLKQGLDLDCERLYAEAESKLGAEIFAEVRQDWDGDTQDFYSHGQSLSEITKNGISAIATPEQKLRRGNELVEEAGTYRTIGKLIMGKGVKIQPVENELSVLTTSQCTDESLELFARKPDSDFGGEVPEIAKMMIRGVRFDRLTASRYEMQVALPGLYITNDIVNQAYQIMGVTAPGSHLDKTDIQGTQVITEGDFDILEYVELLDILASQASGQEIFMGMPIEPGQTKDYKQFEREALQRQSTQKSRAHRLSDQLVEWEQAGVDHWIAQNMVKDYVTKDLYVVARQDPAKAAIIFNKATAIGFQQVATLMQLGLLAEADQKRIEVEKAAPPIEYCTGGACGIKEYELTKTEMKKLGIESLDGYKVAKDTERSCKCGQKTILYVYNDKEVQKYCTNKQCNAKEIKHTYKANK